MVAAYYRPDSLDEALSLLAEPNRVPLAGGTVVNADREPSEIEVVDLQALGLGGVEHDGDRVRLGAT
ncbi:MAG: xanthine dehydrogenase family protein subunit M, partial [Actinobacteria bacterium]|nr:xanthine dehydrogenase family protein subunit M [Actinomycetota bacterium]NIS30438.1 xanthine dehydrogenase family protein subunit M [Actinomycetota bacterium]NIT95058.1 xanthine dehydrogenase family protein subunit M [Actinomycetota bacterium]NIU18732.1 xanthine dehydrogenase family protein subunit M [Actinomycetota bacterium]NIV86586.1 xanthine dehydrogenase family protein subunit M [Actinomycetota bacterium]